MPDGETRKLRLEIAHVLFIDIVGYSKLSIDEQRRALERLNEAVQSSIPFQEAEATNHFAKLPTGDGMALVFYDSPESPVECAMEIARKLSAPDAPRVRMGIHSGAVSGVVDVTGRGNVAGEGINMAQRVMDCGESGHILLSKRVADDLSQFKQWRPHLHDLGECEVKHGLRIGLVNLFTAEIGNSDRPAKLECVPTAPRELVGPARKESRRPWIAAGVTALLALVAVILFVRGRTTEKPASLTANVLEKSIAVLPFENLSRDPDNAYFTDGVQDEILTHLAKIADLKVISRTSVMQYRSGLARNLRKIGEELGVAHVVEGSVQRAANKIRVNAQLIDARNDAHLWAQTYDRDLADVFAIQSEIAMAIANQLQAKLSSGEKSAIAKAPTHDVTANDLYLRAKELSQLANDPGGKPSLLEGVRLLDEAVRRDPQFLLAYCLLSRFHMDLYWNGMDHTPARRELANAALQKAERIQPDAGEIHVFRADYYYHGFRDYDRARQESELARRTLPNEAAIYFQIAAIDRRQARWEESIRNFTRAIELDPRNFVIVEELGFTYAGLSRFDESKRLLQQALSISPRDYWVRSLLGQLDFWRLGDVAVWRAALTNVADEGRDAATHVAFPLVYCSLAERNRQHAEQALEVIPPEGLVDPFTNVLLPRDWFVGLVARTFGENERAQAAFAAARAVLERTTVEQPEFAPAWSTLGVVDAALGRREEAIREGQHACELLPVSKDAWEGPSWAANLAMIYAWVGDKEAALRQLEPVVKDPAGPSHGDLKLLPFWDPLRGDPRFEKIVASLAPKE